MKKNEVKSRMKKVLEKSFSREDCVQCFLLKPNKVIEKYENIIIFKAKNRIESAQIDSAKLNLKIELNQSFDIINWNEIVNKIIPKSKVYKIPFFSSRNNKIWTPWRQCPIGYHWVKQHDRQRTTLEDVDSHCRRNPTSKDLLKGDEIVLISTTDIFLKPLVKVSSNDIKMDFVNLEKQNKYDELISGWTAYWNDIFKLENPLHPNYVKANYRRNYKKCEKS